MGVTSLINLFCICETRMRYPRNWAVYVLDPAGLMATEWNYAFSFDAVAYEEKLRTISIHNFFCSVSVSGSFSHEQITSKFS